MSQNVDQLKPETDPILAPRNRLGRISLWIVALFGSLIAFPNALPLVVLGWLSYYSFLVYQNRPSIVPLTVCLLLLAIKFPEPSAWLALLAFSMLLQVAQPRDNHFGFKFAIWGCWIMFAASFWLGSHTSEKSQPEPDRPVVCLGDSLTDYGYPQELEKLLRIPVADFGFNGYTTEEGIKLLDDIVALNPQAVIIELGGHDFKDGQPRAQTKANLKNIIETCRASQARVVLVEIPRGFINDPYYGLERELAREFDLQLIPDTMIRRIIFWSPIIPPGSLVGESLRNSKDGLHPNDNGNRMMAGYVADALTQIFGKDVLAKPASQKQAGN